MSWFSNIFSPDTASKAVDGIYNGIDKAFYTDEEKAEALQKQLDTKLKLLDKFAPFKLSQRFIAISFTLNFIAAFWAGAVLLFLGKTELLSAFISLVATFQLGWIMVAIVTWYFTGGIIDSAKKKKGDSDD
jgi:hypothetical protein